MSVSSRSTTTPDLPRAKGPLARPAGASVPWWEPAVLPAGLTRPVFLAVAGLVVMHVVVSLLSTQVGDFPGRDPLVRVFDLDEERSLPAWFSTLLLAAVAQQLWVLARRPGAPRAAARTERLLAVVFAYLSLDEMTSLHEQTITPLGRALDLDGALSYGWVLLFVPAALVVGLLSLGWLRSLPREAGRLVLLAGALYVGGAAGVELMGAQLFSVGMGDSLTYQMVVVLEEGGEILGALLMLSVLCWLRRRPAPAG